MPWWLVWLVLVLGTLAGAVWLGRRLWRSAVALGRELARGAEVAAELSARVEELQAQAAAAPIRPTVLDDREVHRRRVAALRVERERRRAARTERHARTWASWSAYWR